MSSTSASNGNGTSVPVDSYHAAMFVWNAVLFWETNILAPVSCFLGMPMLLLITFVMPLTSVKPKPKMFYTLIACCSTLPQLFLQCFIYLCSFLSTLPLKVWFFELQGNLECQFSRFFMASGDFLVGYLLILFAIERFVAVTFPLKVRVFTMKRSAAFCAAIVFSGLAFNSLSFAAYILQPDASDAPCGPRSDKAKLIFSVFFVNSTVPSCLLLLLASMTFLSLQNYHKSAMKAQNNAMRGIKSTKTLLALATIRCCVYVPQSVLYVTWQFIPDRIIAGIIRCLANYFDLLSGLCGIADFLVYVVQIADFRKKLLNLFCCRLCR